MIVYQKLTLIILLYAPFFTYIAKVLFSTRPSIVSRGLYVFVVLNNRPYRPHVWAAALNRGKSPSLLPCLSFGSWTMAGPSSDPSFVGRLCFSTVMTANTHRTVKTQEVHISTKNTVKLWIYSKYQPSFVRELNLDIQHYIQKGMIFSFTFSV